MKKINVCMFALFGCLLFTLKGCNSEDLNITYDTLNSLETELPEVAAKGNLPSANGHGTLRFDDSLTRHFTFHVNTMTDGTVEGNGVLRRSNDILEFNFNIDCLTIFDNTAVMMGTVKSSLSHPQSVGKLFWFKVIDNGEDSSVPDQISFFYINLSNPDLCGVNFGVPIFDIDGGEIQLKN